MAQVTIRQAFRLAAQHHQGGRLHEAEQIYRQILAEQPAHADAMHNLGVLAHQAGRHDIAVDLIRQAIALRPTYAEACNSLGTALKDQGQIDEAVAAYRRAVVLNASIPEFQYNLGNALTDNGQFEEAIAAYRHSLDLRPDYAEAHLNLGNALRAKGELDQAVIAYRRAIAARPNYPEAHVNLGNALKAGGDRDESVALYRRAIVLRPDFPEAYFNLGNSLRDETELDEAVIAYRQALDLRPSYAEAHNNLGNVLKDKGELDEAIAAYRRAVAFNPRYVEAHSNLAFAMHLHPAMDVQNIARELGNWSVQHAQPLRRPMRPHSNDRDPTRRLRIGYLSPDFREHVVGRNLIPLFLHRDRTEFQVTCYAQMRRPDAMTSRFQQNADGWRNIVGFSDEQSAEQIRADQIDVLVDLSLHSAENRLLIFARKPAPVQVTFAGYPGTTGLSAIDYRLSDSYLDPPGMDESVYTEKTIRLPDTFWCYDPLDCRDIAVGSLPALQKGVVTFGCLNNFCKVNDQILRLWSRVLQQVQDSRLLLLSHPGSHRQRLLDHVAGEAIDPARIEFVCRQPRRAYMQLYHRIDIGLDTFPYNGHTTSLDSFWMGVPVVTLVGQTAVSRAGWCQLSNLALTELAAQTPEQFVAIAAELANDLPRLQELRSTLRHRMEQSPLMDAPKFARNIEAAYRQMWRTWCGNPSL